MAPIKIKYNFGHDLPIAQIYTLTSKNTLSEGKLAPVPS